MSQGRCNENGSSFHKTTSSTHQPAWAKLAPHGWSRRRKEVPRGRPLGGTSPLLSKRVKHADTNDPTYEWSSPEMEKFQEYFSWVSQCPVFLYRKSVLPLLNHTRNMSKRRTEKITDLWAVLVIFISSLQSWVKESCACLQLSPTALSQLPKHQVPRSPSTQNPTRNPEGGRGSEQGIVVQDQQTTFWRWQNTICK